MSRGDVADRVLGLNFKFNGNRFRSSKSLSILSTACDKILLLGVVFFLVLIPTNNCNQVSTSKPGWEEIRNKFLEEEKELESRNLEKKEEVKNATLPVEVMEAQNGQFTSKEIRIGFITHLKRKSQLENSLPTAILISGAFPYAVDTINNDSTILPDHTITYQMVETYGEEIESLYHTAKFIQQGIHAIIGPQKTCVHEARLAAAFNVPMISFVSTLKFHFNREMLQQTYLDQYNIKPKMKTQTT